MLSVAVGMLLLAATGIGHAAGSRMLGGEDRSFLALGAPMIGLGVIALSSYTLLAISGVQPVLHLLVPGVGLLLLGRDRREFAASVTALRREMTTAWYPTLGIISLVGLLMLAYATGPVVDWDSLSFHDRVPQQLLNARSLMVPSDNLHVAQLGLVHLASIPLRVVGSAAGVALLSTAMSLLLLLAGSLVAKRIAGSTAAVLTVTSLAGTPMLLLVGMTPRVDGPLAAALLLALVAWISDLMDGSSRRTAWVIALLGCAAAIKFHGIAFAAIALPMVVWTGRHQWRLVVVGMIVAAGLSVPYLAANVAHFGTPIYPFLAAPRLEPWLASALGSSTMPAAMDLGFLDTVAAARQSFSLWGFLFEPAALTIEYEGLWYRPSLMLLILPVAIFHLPRRAGIALVAPALCYSALVLSVSSTTNLRYLLPSVVMLTISAAAGTGAAIDRHLGQRRSRSIIIAAAVIAGCWPTLGFFGSWRAGEAFRHLVGAADNLQFRRNHPDPTVRGFAGIPEWASTVIGPDQQLLLLFEARGGAFDVPVLADTRSLYWPVLAQTSLPATCLSGTGITHVLLNAGAVDYYGRRGVEPQAMFLPELSHFMQRCLSPLGQHNGFHLYAVTDPASSRVIGEGTTP